MKKITALCAIMLLIALSNASQATMLTFTLVESGGNVVGTVSGSVNTSKLTGEYGGENSGYIMPSTGYLSIGTIGRTVYLWKGIEGPTEFGTKGGKAASSGVSAASYGVAGNNHGIYLPSGYVSGSLISGTTTWDNNTLSGLGVTTGTYTWTYNGGADSVVLQAAVPEPATMALLGLGGLMIRRRKA